MMDIKALQRRAREVAAIATRAQAEDVRQMATEALEKVIAEYQRTDPEGWARLVSMTDEQLRMMLSGVKR